MNTVIIDDKQVDIKSFEFDQVDIKDYPDFCDAYVSHAEFTDGTALSEYQLDVLSDMFYSVVYEQLLENYRDFA